jgi:hypothetical protein
MLRRSALIFGLSTLIMGACTLVSSTTKLPPTNTAIPTRAPTPEVTCETHTASVVLTASDESIEVGDTVNITVTLNNIGCVALGLPQYQLRIHPSSIFAPNSPEPVEHYLAVAPGQSDTVEFELSAISGGQATLMASASFEVHLGYPGPAYWGSSSGGPLFITVAP